MKFVIALCFLAVAYTVSAEEKEETEVRNVEAAAPEQARACVGTKEKCVEGDDCSCCGEWDSCDCNNPNERGVCRCKYAMIYTRVKKMVKC
uniref:U32-Eretoxin-Ek1a_2 n=1 Tax=Eresus cinnaberinus TaxID=175337 RepID=A0A2D0PCH8_ERECI